MLFVYLAAQFVGDNQGIIDSIYDFCALRQIINQPTRLKTKQIMFRLKADAFFSKHSFNAALISIEYLFFIPFSFCILPVPRIQSVYFDGAPFLYGRSLPKYN